ncbi:MFS transporter [Streptacidiphilus pinicola]|uniref:MFS transporter n=1 Tax=Streptacidiphilus pinicola TaxID=2219663 RepID=A0A2X0I9S6_9ACTN|nr:MFS transporter [Streptacidiphilus pinicola]RAG80403.1 MFS transporter [Streptacidiphilus pinicola]
MGDAQDGNRAGDGRELRRARIAISAVFAIHGAAAGSFATRIPWIKDHLHLSAGQLGLALVAPAIGSFVSMPLAGRILHARGHRAGNRLLISLYAAALVLPALAPNLPLLVLVLFCYGATAGIADVAMNAQAVEVEARLGRSIMSGLHGMWSVGGLLGSGVGVAAAALATPASVHLPLMAALLVLLSAVACRGLLDVRPEPEEEAPPRFALPPRSAVAIGLVGFCAVFAEGASGDWSGVYLRSTANAAPAVAAASYTAFAATMAFARLSGDAAVRRFGAVRSTRGSGALALVGGLLVVTAQGAAQAITGFALLGIGIAVVVPLCFAAAGHSGDNPSRAIAGVATVTYTSGLVAPATVGAIAQATSLRVSFGVVTALTLGLVAGAQLLAPRVVRSGRTVSAAQSDAVESNL